jgi:hypothetical protein
MQFDVPTLNGCVVELECGQIFTIESVTVTSGFDIGSCDLEIDRDHP